MEFQNEIFICPACEIGKVECVCEGYDDEWECNMCSFKITKGSNLLRVYAALTKANKKIKHLKSLLNIKEKLVMSFEEIPEDKKESYPCPDCKNGSVTLSFDETKWECDTCNYEYEVVNG